MPSLANILYILKEIPVKESGNTGLNPHCKSALTEKFLYTSFSPPAKIPMSVLRCFSSKLKVALVIVIFSPSESPFLKYPSETLPENEGLINLAA